MTEGRHGSSPSGKWQRIYIYICWNRLQYFKTFENTGSVHSTKPDRVGTRVLSGHEELLVVGLLLGNLALYLSEICQKLYDVTNTVVSAPTVCRVIRRHGFTRKKI